METRVGGDIRPASKIEGMDEAENGYGGWPGGWVEKDGALHNGHYAVVSAGGRWRAWVRPPFRGRVLLGTFDDVKAAQESVETFELGRRFAWAEIKERIKD